MTTSSGPGCDIGIATLGRIAWGSHFCNFYRAQNDLAESVVPFFQKGLAHNEMGSVTAQALRSALDRLAEAERGGFAGVRMNGNSYWLERKYWTLFSEYEEKVQATVRNSRIVVLCYSLERCTPSDVLQVLTHHDFALVRNEKGWQRIESSTLPSELPG